MISAKNQILSFLLRNRDGAMITAKDISKKLNLNYNTVRGRLSELKRDELVKKPELVKVREDRFGVFDVAENKKRRIQWSVGNKKKVEKQLTEAGEKFVEEKKQIVQEVPEEIIFYRKIVKTVLYCGQRMKGDIKHVYAITYEDNEIDRTKDLWNAIHEDFRFRSCDDIGKRAPDLSEEFGVDIGYDDNQEILSPPFMFPRIDVGEES